MNEYEKEKKKIKRYIAKAKKDMRLSSVPRNIWENFYNGLEKKLNFIKLEHQSYMG